MAMPFTSEDLILLGYDEIKPIDVGDSGIAFAAKAKAGIELAEHTFVYIKTDATKEELISIALRLKGRDSLYVLKSKSGPTDANLKSAFGRATIRQLEDLLWQRVNDLFKAYARTLVENIPVEPNYIAPRSGGLLPHDRLDDFLIENFTKNQSSTAKKFVVLKANAGVGKTTLSRKLARDIAAKISGFKVVPVYVEAAHWGGRLTSNSALWDIIQMSLQNFDPGSLINRSLFEAALKRGNIVFILDGFDELCSSPRSNISAAEAINFLRELAADSDARILLTTRTPYWDAEIGEDPAEVHSIDLLPFNPQQAKAYIRKFFEREDNKFEIARSMHAAVITHANEPSNSGGARAQFWNLPIAVSMICEAVKSGVSPADWHDFSLENLLIAICERESRRQGLSISGAKQLAAFKEISLLASQTNVEFDRDDLAASGVAESDLHKLNSHPLVRLHSNGAFGFAYDFLAPFLRALSIKEAISANGVEVRRSLLDAMRAEENGKGFQIDHASRLLEKSDIQNTIRFLGRIPKTERSSRSFAIHLLLRHADAGANAVSTTDRREILLEALGITDSHLQIRDELFTGAYERIDLSGIEFVGCNFRDIFLKNVSFKSARFKSCTFDGDFTFQTRADEDTFAEAELGSDCEIRGDRKSVV